MFRVCAEVGEATGWRNVIMDFWGRRDWRLLKEYGSLPGPFLWLDGGIIGFMVKGSCLSRIREFVNFVQMLMDI